MIFGCGHTKTNKIDKTFFFKGKFWYFLILSSIKNQKLFLLVTVFLSERPNDQYFYLKGKKYEDER